MAGRVLALFGTCLVIACWAVGLLGAPSAPAAGSRPVAVISQTYNIPPPQNTPPAGSKLSDGARSALIAGGGITLAAGFTFAKEAVTVGIGIATAAAGVTTAPVWVPIALGVAGVALIAGGAAALWYAGTHSPADRHFTRIAKPVSTQFPAIALPGSNLGAVAALETTLLSRSLRGYALAKVFWTSEDRAHGARNARNRTWYERQLRAAVTYARASAAMFASLPSLQSKLSSALVAAGALGTVTASGHQPNVPTSAPSLVSHTGLTRVLRRLGLLGKVENETTATGPASSAAFTQALADPRLLTSYEEAAAALRTYATVARRQQHKF